MLNIESEQYPTVGETVDTMYDRQSNTSTHNQTSPMLINTQLIPNTDQLVVECGPMTAQITE